jgi:predicted nucleotidyltransferase
MIQQYLDTIKECILSELAEERVAIALFGSTVTWKNTSASDINIAVIPKGQWNRWKLSLLREKIEDHNVPYHVDLVDFSMVSDSFRVTALRSILWWRQ